MICAHAYTQRKNGVVKEAIVLQWAVRITSCDFKPRKKWWDGALLSEKCYCFVVRYFCDAFSATRCVVRHENTRRWMVVKYLWPILYDRAAITSVLPLAPPSRTSVMLPRPLTQTQIIPTRPDWTGLNNNSYNNWKDMTYVYTQGSMTPTEWLQFTH